jgi:predicted dehydrogenase
VLATLHVGWADPLGAPAKSFQRVELECEQGRVRADQTARGFQVWSDDGTREINPYFFQQLPDPVTGELRPSGYGYESVARFLDFCIADSQSRGRLRESETLPWLRQALLAERLLAAAQASLADAATPWVTVP